MSSQYASLQEAFQIENIKISCLHLTLATPVGIVIFSNYFNVSNQSERHSISISTDGLNLSLNSSANKSLL